MPPQDKPQKCYLDLGINLEWPGQDIGIRLKVAAILYHQQIWTILPYPPRTGSIGLYLLKYAYFIEGNYTLIFLKSDILG